jgi:hypothetical protein
VITSKEAATVAKAHKLSLTDAAALARLADSPEEADELAALFADAPPTPAETNLSINQAIRARAHR